MDQSAALLFNFYVMETNMLEKITKKKKYYKKFIIREKKYKVMFTTADFFLNSIFYKRKIKRFLNFYFEIRFLCGL